MATAYKAATYYDTQLTMGWGMVPPWKRYFKFDTASTNGGFVINDTVALCAIPYLAAEGVLVVDFHVDLPALDTGTSVTVSLGDTNGTAGAFEATWYDGIAIGRSSAAGVMAGVEAFAGATPLARNGTSYALPKQYTISGLYANYTKWPTIDFSLLIKAAPQTATTTGIIKGWLELNILPKSAVTF